MTSPRVTGLSWPSEVFYRRLMSVVDDYGRFHAHHMLLRAACYPMQLDKVSDSDIGKWLGECQKAALVRVYPAPDGKRYLELLDFRQQVRAKQSKFPPPDEQMHSECVADAQQPLADAHLDVCGDEGVGGVRKRTRKTPLPPDFDVSERVKAWATKNGYAALDKHLESFVSKCKAKGYAYVDWDEAFMGAIRDDWARIGKPKSSVPAFVAP